MELSVASRIDTVHVYARGAVVVRRARIDAAAAEELTVVLGGLTAAAEPASFRVSARGRDVLAVRCRLVVPEGPAGPGPALSRLRQIEREERALERERDVLSRRRERLVAQDLATPFGEDRKHEPHARAGETLAIGAMLDDAAALLEERLSALDDEREAKERERQAAELDLAQAQSAELLGAGHPTRDLLISLGAGAVAVEIEVSYVVAAARWWPAYSARLSDDGALCDFAFAALVAQATGEDWTGVALSLSTADLARDARLPELPSLRLGRKQPRPARAYRALPEGLDAMFAGYDESRRALAPPRPAIPMPVPLARAAAAEDTIVNGITLDAADKTFADGSAETGVFPAFKAMADERERRVPLGRPAPPPAPPQPMAAPAPSTRAGAAPVAKKVALAPPSAIEPDDAWLDFDLLALAPPDGGPRRGRLTRDTPVAIPEVARGMHAIETTPAPPLGVDPLRSRGTFDHRYDAAGHASIPSNGRPHRIVVGERSGPSQPRFRSVPRESPEVYREVELPNPLEAPLLSGPIDLFVGGALLTTSPFPFVDRGGLVRLGLGVDDRIRVARNVRAEEASAGLLGGATAIEHTVSIELASALGHPATIVLHDRVPVTDEKDLDVSWSATPPAEKYDQSDLGSPVRGGVRWLLTLPPGGRTEIRMRYRLKMPAKAEVLGGNRRE